jgi:pyruvate,water dikinase
MKYIRDFKEISINDVVIAGGKGASLGEMTKAGIPVPPGFVITTEAFDIYSSEIPNELAEEILASYKALGADKVAVRSSATAEDSEDAAWAGQLESFLNTTEENLLENVKKCWESLNSPRAVFYRQEHGLEAKNVSVAVVVQK